MRPGDRVLSRYLIESPAGSGAMGIVFRGRDTSTGRLVAIKVLRDAWSDALPRFKREAEVLSELSDPRIVGYLAHGMTENGEAFLIMEWLEGQTLDQRLDARPLTGREALVVSRTVAEALVVAHAHNIVHRDLKPANIFLEGGTCERVKVVDFGIARMRKPGQTMTGSGEILGTPAYMSPEQASARQDLDQRSDLFSLGSVLFECLTGRTPFDRPSALAVLIALSTERAPRLRSVVPDVPPALADVVDAMLAQAPASRPQSAAWVAGALKSIEQDAANRRFLDAACAKNRSPRSLTIGGSLATGPTLSPTTAPPQGNARSAPPTLRYTEPRTPSKSSRAVIVLTALGLGAVGVAGVGVLIASQVGWLGAPGAGHARPASVDSAKPLDCGFAIGCAPLGDVDTTDLDAFTFLPKVMSFARTIRPTTEFVSAVVMGVDDGSINLKTGSTIFVSTTSRLSVMVKANGMFAINDPLEPAPSPLPGCSLKTAYKRALGAGLPAHPSATFTVGQTNIPDRISALTPDAKDPRLIWLNSKDCSAVR